MMQLVYLTTLRVATLEKRGNGVIKKNWGGWMQKMWIILSWLCCLRNIESQCWSINVGQSTNLSGMLCCRLTKTVGLIGRELISFSSIVFITVFVLLRSFHVGTEHDVIYAFHTSSIHPQPYENHFFAENSHLFFTTFSDAYKVLLFSSGSNLEQV